MDRKARLKMLGLPPGAGDLEIVEFLKENLPYMKKILEPKLYEEFKKNLEELEEKLK